MEIIKKILIVDDKQENLIALEKLLSECDVEIVKAGSGTEALALILEHEFALALIDVQMPDMDGYETVKLMRQVEQTRYLPVIFLSAIYSENHYLIQGIEAGAVDFITKPIQPRILLGKIKIFLDLYVQKKKLELEIEHRKKTEVTLLETEQELLVAKAKAEESDMLKSAFLANMSHEIRTPLNAIVGFANLLAEESLSRDKKEQYLNYIFNNSETLTGIISDILDIAKIEAGQMVIKPTPVDINHMLGELLDTFREEVRRKSKGDIQLVLKLPENPFGLKIMADSVRLKQVFMNLLQNALKFTLNGFIEFGYRVPNDMFLECYVKDTGVGIDKDKLGIIFDRFQKVTNKNVQNPTGTGLGLSIVKKIIELSGGKIEVESEVDQGTRFTFTIPLVLAPDQLVVAAVKPVHEQGEEYLWPSRKILIAEDEYSNFLLLEEILEPTQVNITWAHNGREAVDAYDANNCFDLVLMDIKMPVMSGVEAFKELRRENDRLPIVAITAYAMVDDREQFLSMGFNNYITKPIVKRELLQLIDSFLS
jgi:Signal transduction histidine kinase